MLGAHGDVLDEDPGQQRHLLRSVVVAGAAFGQPNQAICKGKHQALQGQAALRGVSLQAQAGEGQTAVLYSPEAGTQGEPFRDKGHRYSLHTTAVYSACLHCLSCCVHGQS